MLYICNYLVFKQTGILKCLVIYIYKSIGKVVVSVVQTSLSVNEGEWWIFDSANSGKN